jgi:hypothetical protein
MNDTLVSVNTEGTSVTCNYYGSHKAEGLQFEAELNLDAIFAQLRWEPVALSADMFWAAQLDTTSTLIKVYRGLAITMPKGELEQTCDDAEAFLKQHVNLDRIGIHWSDNIKAPRNFSHWERQGCDCATCEPYNWQGNYLRNRILQERQAKMKGVWNCAAGCDHCSNVKAEFLKGCRCQRCLGYGPWQCNGYCDTKAPCQKWRTVTAKEKEAYTDDKMKVGVAVVFEGETDIGHTLTSTDDDYAEYKNLHAIFGYDEEQEITLRYQSPVRITKVAIKSYHIEREHTVNLTVTT